MKMTSWRVCDVVVPLACAFLATCRVNNCAGLGLEKKSVGCADGEYFDGIIDQCVPCSDICRHGPLSFCKINCPEYHERRFITSTAFSSSPSTTADTGVSSTPLMMTKNIIILLAVLAAIILLVVGLILSVDIVGVWRRRTFAASGRHADSSSKFRLLRSVSSFSADRSSADVDRCETADEKFAGDNLKAVQQLTTKPTSVPVGCGAMQSPQLMLMVRSNSLPLLLAEPGCSLPP